MNKGKEKIPQTKKRFSNKELSLISIILATLIVSSILLSRFLLQAPEPEFSLNAGIVDQLGTEFPNPEFNDTGTVANMLRNAGFSVFYHRSETVDVTLYERLAELNYGLIILRAHSAQRADETVVDFFTSETFDPDRYTDKLNNGLLTQGRYSWKPGELYFAVPPKFIENLKGSFPKSIIIAMGCNSLNETCREMAEAFKRKGSSAYIGWTGMVDTSHTDSETIKLLQDFVVGNKTLAQAVRALTSDPIYGSKMRYFPPESADLKLTDLVADRKASTLLQSFANCFSMSIQTPIASVAYWKVKAFKSNSG